jgi:hypothetical protein
MDNNIDAAVEMLKKAQNMLKDASADMNKSKSLFKLAELGPYVERFCIDNFLQKRDLCLLAGISSTTLTNTLKNPEKASMSTVLSIGEIVGFELLIGRKND